jgi:AraC-like DNA-binding protein
MVDRSDALPIDPTDEDLARLSRVAAFSKYHFQRQFSALFGMGVYKYVQLVRLRRASYQLAFRGDDRIIDIALGSGYETPIGATARAATTAGRVPSSSSSVFHSPHAGQRPSHSAELNPKRWQMNCMRVPRRTPARRPAGVLIYCPGRRERERRRRDDRARLESWAQAKDARRL